MISVVIVFLLLIIVLPIVLTQCNDDSGDGNTSVVKPYMDVTDVPKTLYVYEGDHSIPKRIMQTYKGSKIPKGMAAAVQSQIDMNPGFEHVYFDNDACDRFMYEHYKGDVSDAYHCIRPGAFKCDIFRLAYLLKHGGWYIDVSMVAQHSLDVFYQDKYNGIDTVLVKDKHPDGYYIYQAFIGVRPESDLIRFILNSTVQRVLVRDIPSDSTLSLTGPRGFGKDMNVYFDRRPMETWPVGRFNDFLYIAECRQDEYMYTSQDSTQSFMAIKYENWREERIPGAHYDQMFHEGKVFNRVLPEDTGSISDHTIFIVTPSRYVSHDFYDVVEEYRDTEPEVDDYVYESG